MKTNEPNEPTTIEEYESYVRMLRENIYGYIDDIGWANVRDNWMKPENVTWLKEQQQVRNSNNELANP